MTRSDGTLVYCFNCETLNNTFVNRRCYRCGKRLKTTAETVYYND